MEQDGYTKEITIELDSITTRRLNFLVETGMFREIEDAAKYVLRNATEYIFKNDGKDLY